MLFAAIFVAWFAFGGVIGFEIGYGKGLGRTGFWLGGLLGFIGWIVVAVMEPSAEIRTARNRELATAFSGTQQTEALRPCPWCAEPIRSAAVICRYCGRDVDWSMPSQVRRPASVVPKHKKLEAEGLARRLSYMSADAIAEALRAEVEESPDAQSAYFAIDAFMTNVHPDSLPDQFCFSDGQFKLLVRDREQVFACSGATVNGPLVMGRVRHRVAQDGDIKWISISGTRYPNLRPRDRANAFVARLDSIEVFDDK